MIRNTKTPFLTEGDASDYYCNKSNKSNDQGWDPLLGKYRNCARRKAN